MALIRVQPPMVAPVTATGATTARKIEDRLADWLSVLDFYGAVPLSDAGALSAAIAAGMASGKRVVVPARTYTVAASIVVSATAPIDIEFDSGAKLIAPAAPVTGTDGAILNIAANGYRVRIRGGYWDSSAQPSANQALGQSWAALYVSNADGLDVEDAVFYAGADFKAAAGDSHIFAWGKRIRIQGCTFLGGDDAAVYLSGNTSETGSWLNEVVDCHFIGCSSGVIYKRQGTSLRVANCTFDMCQYGVVTGESETVKLPGKRIQVVNNTFRRCQAPIDVRISDGSVIAGNLIRDYAYDPTTNTEVANGYAISLSGSKYCLVTDNIISLVDWVVTTSNTFAIVCKDYTVNGTAYYATDNQIANNIVDRAKFGVYENSANIQRNRYLHNQITNASTTYSVQSTAFILGFDGTSGDPIVQMGVSEASRWLNKHFLVGKTANSTATTGVELLNGGVVRATTSAANPLDLNRTTSDGQIAVFRRENTIVGSVSVTATATTYATSSDARLKDVIGPIDDALERLKRIDPVYFRWKALGPDSPAVDGFIAQQLATVLPHAVTGTPDATDEDGKPVYMAVDQSKLTPLLVAAVQALTARVEALEGN